jgi:hypothetical protein
MKPRLYLDRKVWACYLPDWQRTRIVGMGYDSGDAYDDWKKKRDAAALSAAQPPEEEAMSAIKPTPGRVVWFYPHKTDGLHSFGSVQAKEPLAAHIAKVWSDTCVNLMVIDPNGVPVSRTSVFLVPSDSESDLPGSSYATWMPFQVGQFKAATAPATPEKAA